VKYKAVDNVQVSYASIVYKGYAVKVAGHGYSKKKNVQVYRWMYDVITMKMLLWARR
jgi:hypothetical protein